MMSVQSLTQTDKRTINVYSYVMMLDVN